MAKASKTVACGRPTRCRIGCHCLRRRHRGKQHDCAHSLEAKSYASHMPEHWFKTPLVGPCACRKCWLGMEEVEADRREIAALGILEADSDV